jgi:hypothetical protein
MGFAIFHSLWKIPARIPIFRILISKTSNNEPKTSNGNDWWW